MRSDSVPSELWLALANYLGDRSGLNILESRHAWHEEKILKRFELHQRVTANALLPYKKMNLQLVDDSVTEFPSYVLHIFIGFNMSVDNLQLPASLKSLKFADFFNNAVECLQLPDSLTRLSFGYNFNRSIEKLLLPASLKSLEFGTAFNNPVESL